jgi:hypothetical protein
VGVVVQEFIVIGRNCRDSEQPSCGIAWGGGRWGGLTGSRHADVLDALWGAFDKTADSLVAILTNYHTCATKLRHEFKVTENSKFNGGLQIQRLADFRLVQDATYIGAILLAFPNMGYRWLCNRGADRVELGACLFRGMAASFFIGPAGEIEHLDVKRITQQLTVYNSERMTCCHGVNDFSLFLEIKWRVCGRRRKEKTG